MAIIFVALQISLCITLTMAQQPASTNPVAAWLYQPTITVYVSNSLNTLLTPHQGRNQWITTRSDYTYLPGFGAYKVHPRAASWNKGRKTCEAEGGHLVILNSRAEANKVGELFKKAEQVTGTLYPELFSVGIHDFYEEGHFVTIHGQTLEKAGFNEWADGEPNNLSDESCGAMYHDARLLDVNCGILYGFVCELPIN
ncbi:hemolymph lipopolysaccharide-binding protein isoform X1 [Neodiprion lecontei]|uniref:Hemolymph lipopolysaccharide-binding protein isoform X1 n=1 Tax=Neodiprion lecontei TaxID=441921 RepID=A0A6J0BH28_NEOLC|nr:hemolymph lipopolysaccharide-binding protein isoform X1 [Neodiprion lecontei]